MNKKGDYIGELANYIKKNLKKGYTLDSLKYALVSQGHSKLEVEKALKRTQEDQAKEAPILETKPSIVYETIDSDNIQVEDDPRPFWKRIFGIN